MHLQRAMKLTFAAFGLLLFSASAGAATYSITFYDQTSPGNNLYANYEIVGSGSFEINDAAIGPGALVLFTDTTNFLAFDATVTGAQFTLGIDDFPPRGDGSYLNPHEQGILFDAAGRPLRFDTPDTTYGNGAQICDPSCTVSVTLRDTLVLWDDDGFDRVFLGNGDILAADYATANGYAFTPINGAWSINSGSFDGYYLIEPVPTPAPAAVWLFGLGLLGLMLLSGRLRAPR